MTTAHEGTRPAVIDRLIVQQYDISTADSVTIGGIDTCLRGLMDYAPKDVTLAIVGLDDGRSADHRLGRWEAHRVAGRTVYFLPVARFDPIRPRRVPHSLRLVAGLIRHRAAVPPPQRVQAHRLDVALALRLLFRAPLIYSIHTQHRGLVGSTSDSFWRFGGGALYERLDRTMVRLAERVIVFNPGYAERVRRWNPRTVSAPTWFDPATTSFQPNAPDPYSVLWVGRLAVPKDPELAIRAFAHLAQTHPDQPWRLELVGTGLLRAAVERQVAELPVEVRSRIARRGRLGPEQLAEVRGRSELFLMTSHPGYEGYPRVLVEALATGLPAVVTEGSDTGGLVRPGISGTVVRGRDPVALAAALLAARELDRAEVAGVVSALSAPEVVRAVFFDDLERCGPPVREPG
jgi:glycosyltransferase involved in cell wall biosynthesis